MLDRFFDWAFGDPWGIAFTSALGVAIALALLSIVSRGFRALLARFWHWLPKLRFETRERPPIAPARWALRPSGTPAIWVLVNHGAGDARSVQLDPADGESMVVGTGFWPELRGKHGVGVRILLKPNDGFGDESTFQVRWRDRRRVAWGVYIEAFPRERYPNVEKLPPIREDEIVRMS